MKPNIFKKRVVVTGSSKGIGRSISLKFLQSDEYEVIGLSRGDSTINHESYEHYNVDISNQCDLEKVQSTIKRIDILVNNAAIFDYGTFSDMSVSRIEEMININLKGPILTTKIFLPYIQNRIFFINSVAGLEQLDKQSLYCSTKHGLTAFAGVLSKELQYKKIKVTSIHPGGVKTPLWDKFNFHDDLDKLLKPEDIADMVYFISQQNFNVEIKTVKMYPDTEWHQ